MGVHRERVRASTPLSYCQTIVFPPDWTEIVTEDDEDHQQKVPGRASHETGCPFTGVPMQKEVLLDRHAVSDFHGFASCMLYSDISALRWVLDRYAPMLRSHNGDNEL